MSPEFPHKHPLIEKVRAALVHGHIPWSGIHKVPEAPHNPISGVRYDGVNRLLLSLVMRDRALEDPRFLTQKQAELRGWRLEEGAEATTITFSRYRPKDRDPGDQKSPKPVMVRADLYNATDVAGIEPYADRTHPLGMKGVERVIAASGLAVRHSALVSEPHHDERSITMPPQDRFSGQAQYRIAVLREVLGAVVDSRSRDFGALANEPGRRLVVELGTLFLAQDFALDTALESNDASEALADEWATFIEEQPKRFLLSVHQAERLSTKALGLDPDLAKAVGRATALERHKGWAIPRELVEALGRNPHDSLEWIYPRKDYSEYAGPVVSEAKGYMAQRVSDRFMVVHRVSGLDTGTFVRIRYEDGVPAVSVGPIDPPERVSAEDVERARASVARPMGSGAWHGARMGYSQYVGFVEAVNEEHVLQRLSKGSVVVHERERVGEVQPGRRVCIRYCDGAAQVRAAPRRRRAHASEGLGR